MLLREYHNTGDDQDLGVGNTRWITQTYTPKFGQKISRVRIKLYRDTVLEPGTVTLSLRATTASKPSGIDLAVATLDGNSFTTDTNGEWYEFVLNSVVPNLGGVLYSIVLRCAGSGSYPLRIRADSSSGYDSGRHGYSVDSGGTWTMSDTQDDMFETYSDDPAAGSIGFYAGGTRQNTKNLWCVQFDSVANNLVISAAYDIGTLTDIRSLAVGLDGSVYIGTTEGKVYKYTSALILDTTWATNGVYTIAANKIILSLAVDSVGYCAIGHEYTGSPAKSVTLLNASGGLVWLSTQVPAGSAGNVGFDPDSNVIAVVSSISYGQTCGSRLSRVDGSILNNYWQHSGNHNSAGLSIWPNGDVAIVQCTSSYNGTIKKFNLIGTDIWAELALSPGTTGYKMDHDSNGNLYVATLRGTSLKSLQKIAADGSSVLGSYDTGQSQYQAIVTYNDFVVCVGTHATDAGSLAGCFRVFSADLTRLAGIDINSATSLYAVVLNTIPPTITGQSGNTTVNEGEEVNLFVTATGVPDPSYQWHYDDGGGYDLLPGETNSTLVFTAARTDAGYYKCRAYNIVGEDWSNPILLTVQYLEITAQSSSSSVYENARVDLSITAIGIPIPSYQWYKNDVVIDDAIHTIYSFIAKYSGDVYKCKVYNAWGVLYSDSIIVTLLDPLPPYIGGFIKFGIWGNKNPEFHLTRDDLYVEGDTPPVLTSKRDPKETYNRIRVMWTDVNNNYKQNVAVANDEVDQRISGKVRSKELLLLGIQTSALASKMAYRFLAEELYRFTNYNFSLSYKNQMIEVGDVGTLDDGFGIIDQRIRIKSISESPCGKKIDIEAIEDVEFFYLDADYVADRGSIEEKAEVNLVQPEVFFTEDPNRAIMNLHICPNGSQVNGYLIYYSYDDISFKYAGMCTEDISAFPNIYGLTASTLDTWPAVIHKPDENLDVIPTIVGLGSLQSITDEQFFNNVNLFKVNNEVLGFKSATLVSGTYTISNLIRGLFHSEASSHLVDEVWHTLKINFKFEYQLDKIGSTIYFKILPFYGDDVLQLDEADSVSYTIIGLYKKPAPVSITRIVGREGFTTYPVGDVDIRVNLAGKAQGFNIGGFGNILWGSYIRDPDISSVEVLITDLAHAEVYKSSVAVGAEIESEYTKIITPTMLAGTDPALVSITAGAIVKSDKREAQIDSV